MSGNMKKRVLVTSGPTRAYFDSIRYIANISSGALGSRIVERLVNRRVPVIHVYGIGSERPDTNDSSLLESIRVSTVEDLLAVIRSTSQRGDIGAVVHAMAVLDYVPESKFEGKKESGDEFWDIRLVRTPKVIGLIREFMPAVYTVGFKLESGISGEELVNRANALLEKHHLDLVVANQLEKVDEEHHEALFIGPGGKILGRFSSKQEIAAELADFITEHL